MTPAERFAKYDVAVPRYTSYPTVPQWHRIPAADEWLASLTRAAARHDAALAIYVPEPAALGVFTGIAALALLHTIWIVRFRRIIKRRAAPPWPTAPSQAGTADVSTSAPASSTASGTNRP